MDDTDLQNAANGDSGDVVQTTPDKLGWKTELPESLRGHEVFANYQTKNDLWNGHLDLAGKLKDAEGKLANTIPKIGPDATDEDKAAYRAAIGIPDKAEDYEIELVEGDDNALAPWFKDTAFKLGMPKETAKGLSAAWNEMIGKVAKAEAEQSKKDHDAAIEELHKTWGKDSEANAETVKKGYKVFSDNPALESLLNSEITIGDSRVKVGNHPGMIGLILEIGKKITPDSIIHGGPSGGPQPQPGVINYDWGETKPGG